VSAAPFQLGAVTNPSHFTDERIAKVQQGAPLTTEERTFLLEDTPRFEECSAEEAAQLPMLSDSDLMQVAYRVWADYVSTQF
jgi:hypothetical protein